MALTNEQLAEFIQQGAEDLKPVLWERVRRYLYSRTGRYFFLYNEYCIKNGLTEWDLKQQAYQAFEASFASYNIERGAFTIYLSYMLKRKLRDLFSKDPLNKSDSLDRPIGGADDEECDKSPGDFLPDPSAVEAFEQVDDEAERQYISRTMRESIAQLSEPEQDVIKRHFYEQQTLREISSRLGITYAKACTTKNNALKRLRNMKAVRALGDELGYTASRLYHDSFGNFERYGCSVVEYVAIRRAEIYSELENILTASHSQKKERRPNPK